MTANNGKHTLNTPWANKNCRDRNLRLLIGWRIREQRELKFPGHGGGGRCAEAYKVTNQQWSSWETGLRTPDDDRLKQMADFFGAKPEIFKTEPENWAQLRAEFEAHQEQRKRRRHPAPPEPVPTETPENSQGESLSGQPDTPEKKSDTDTWLDVFSLLIDAKRKHDQGRIPDERYREGMKAVKTIVKITFDEQA